MPESIKKNFEKICFSGLLELSKNSIKLRKKQILDGFRIRSSYHYLDIFILNQSFCDNKNL